MTAGGLIECRVRGMAAEARDRACSVCLRDCHLFLKFETQDPPMVPLMCRLRESAMCPDSDKDKFEDIGL